MAKKKSDNKQSLLGSVIAIVVVVVGALFYAVTGIDILGLLSGEGIGGSTEVASLPGDVQAVSIENGLGATKGFWQVYFTQPVDTRDRSQWVNGVDGAVADAIRSTNRTLDIAAFEFSNEVITEAVLDAHERGVTVRVVTDDEHGLEDVDSTIVELELAGIDIVDDDRSGLMHNKFIIFDGASVWMGSMNLTQNGVYRNNNNAILLRSRRAVETYQAEFNEMFERGEFGVRSDPSNTANFTQDGIPMEIYFAAENDVVDEIIAEINSATNSIRFMAFSYTRDDMGEAMVARAEAGVDVQGVFETTGSETQYSEMPRMFCAGLDVRQDGNAGILHHKVIIIDNGTVITGSFNFSNNAVESNDENVLIIRDSDVATLYLQEFNRVRNISRVPDDIDC